MELLVKLVSFVDTFGPRWDSNLSRAAQVRIFQLGFVAATEPAPDNWPVEPVAQLAIDTTNPDALAGLDPSNKDQVYTLTVEPMASARKAKAPAAQGHAAQKEKAPAHGKESGATHHR